jgi:hypothetical protein
MASNTGWMSAGELEITRKISLVAACCSNASARRLSTSWPLAPPPLSDFRAAGSLASTLHFADFAPVPKALLAVQALQQRSNDNSLREVTFLGY